MWMPYSGLYYTMYVHIQSALVISNPRDSLIYIKIPVFRHIRFPELRKKSNNQMSQIRNLTPLHKIYVLKLWWKGEKLLLKSNFFFYPQYLYPRFEKVGGILVYICPWFRPSLRPSFRPSFRNSVTHFRQRYLHNRLR